MSKAVLSLVCFLFLSVPGIANAYEDLPISMHIVVDDSVFFAVDGVEYREIEFEYRPGLQQIYFNGEPVLSVAVAIDAVDCSSYYDDNMFVGSYVEQGLSCGEATARFRDQLSRIAWDIADWLAASEGRVDTLSFVENACGASEISETFEWVILDESGLFLKFQGFDQVKVIAPEDRYMFGSSHKPFGEGVAKYVERLLRKLEQPAPGSQVYFLASSFGGQHGGCCVSRARHQLETFIATGVCVEGPINCSLLEDVVGQKDGR
ncbi:MAG: hypothetical protein GY768_19325 [Planctomycetaceae bacterium]|nr:hypothetical protein [Planctomycetaceae bacterium]